ncbi:MAG: mitochondrial thiamine pyrophosphate transporter [Watsoniomyces obsoletus]|nr:MAG: mitochondrial thiamine pyrophosphate transporter [Watsoniomyces obsoletus]
MSGPDMNFTPPSTKGGINRSPNLKMSALTDPGNRTRRILFTPRMTRTPGHSTKMAQIFHDISPSKAGGGQRRLAPPSTPFKGLLQTTLLSSPSSRQGFFTSPGQHSEISMSDSPPFMLTSDPTEVREAIKNSLPTSDMTSNMYTSDSMNDNNDKQEDDEEEGEIKEETSNPSSEDEHENDNGESPLHLATLSPQARSSTPDLLTFQRNHLLLPDPDSWWDELFGWAPDQDDVRGPPPAMAGEMRAGVGMGVEEGIQSDPFSITTPSPPNCRPMGRNKRTISQAWTACESSTPPSPTPPKSTKLGHKRSDSNKENQDPDDHPMGDPPVPSTDSFFEDGDGKERLNIFLNTSKIATPRSKSTRISSRLPTPWNSPSPKKLNEVGEQK